MVRKTLSLVMMCALLLAVGCAEDNPVEPCREYKKQIATKESTIAVQAEQIESLTQEKSAGIVTIASQEKQLAQKQREIETLEQGLWDNLHAPQSQPVVKGVLKIQAGRYSDSTFTVTARMSNVRLQGDFREVGGSDLYVYLFDSLNFVNWSAGGDSKVLYNSGKVVVGEIDVAIRSAGTYHLVFSNTHSWLTQKNVDAAVDLWFEM